MLIIGAVILVVGIILLVSGFVSGSKGQEVHPVVTSNDPDKGNLTERLKKLDELKSAGLITQEEYDEKRKQLISSL